MPVRVPRFRPLNGDVVEINDLNEVFQEIAGDVSSALNEHSFLAGAFVPYESPWTAAAKWQSDSFVRAYQETGLAASPVVTSIKAAGEVILSVEIETIGGHLHCVASFQATVANTSARFWLTVNGAVCTEAMIADLDTNGKVYTGGVPASTGYEPFVLDTVQAVPPGSVVVQLVAQATDNIITVLDRELFVLEYLN